MNVSETNKCYVYGQCQVWSLCQDICKANKLRYNTFRSIPLTLNTPKMWSYATGSAGKRKRVNGGLGSLNNSSACSLPTARRTVLIRRQLSLVLVALAAKNCTDIECWPNQVSALICYGLQNLRRCPARVCQGAFKCQGTFVDSHTIDTLEECIEKCTSDQDCQWFTLEKRNHHCILYEECNKQFNCDTCATGEKKCSMGYHGYFGQLFVLCTFADCKLHVDIVETSSLSRICRYFTQIIAIKKSI